ncbi:MAG: hypothetical protein Q4C22_08225, partial [Bacillota bacterium]|nr:hypothetical protein [Bacillota bacterium]
DAVELLEQEAVGSESLSTQGLQIEEHTEDFIVEFESKLGEAKEYLPELYLPGYVPEGYAFVELEIRRTSPESFIATYVYDDGANVLLIHQRQKERDGGGLFADYIVEGEALEGGAVYYQEDPEAGVNSCTYFWEEDLELYAAGRLDRETLEQILTHFLP